MFSSDHLSLIQVQLKRPEQWACCGNGFFLVIGRGGCGECFEGNAVRTIRAGDLLLVSGSTGAKLSAAEGGAFVFACFRASLESLLPLVGQKELWVLESQPAGHAPGRFCPREGQVAAECSRLLKSMPHGSVIEHRSRLLRIVASVLAAGANDGPASA